MASSGVGGKPGPTQDSVRRELDKILDTKAFTASARLSRFLRFTVEEALADRSGELKEYTIATEVYGKDSTFDPRIDPIVRVEARRLRDRLKEYYEAEGRADPVRIELPKGAYVPTFKEVPVEAVVVEAAAPPEATSPQGVPPPATASRAFKIRLAALVLLLILIPAAWFAWQRFRPQHNSAGRIMLAVLPFQNLTGDAGLEYLSDGMTEEMSVRLGALDPQRMGVIARTSAMKYKHTTKSVDEIGKELAVDYVLEGSVRSASPQLRVTAQLIQVRDQTHLWAKNYDRDSRDIFAVQGDIADAISGEVRIKVNPGRTTPEPRVRPVDPDAHEAYLRGRYFSYKGTPESFEKGIHYFEEAIRKYPDYALAHAALADAYAFLGYYHTLPPAEAFAKSRREATRALEIDPNLAEAHATLGAVLETHWDWTGSGRELRRAIELQPNYAPAHLYYAGYLGLTGHMPEALAEVQVAQKLDPVSPNVNAELADAYTGMRDYDRAITQSLRTLDLEPDYPQALRYLGESYDKKGMEKESFDAYLKFSVLSGLDSTRIDRLKKAFAASGMKGFWAERIKIMLADGTKDPYYSPFRIALFYARIGDKEASLEWLQKAYAEHDFRVAFVKLDSVFDFIGSDPRFQDLIRRMGLP